MVIITGKKKITALSVFTSILSSFCSGGIRQLLAPIAPIPKHPVRFAKRERSKLTPRVQAQIKQSKKRGLVRDVLSQRKGPWTTVFIGNIDSSFEEADILDVFKACGRVEKVEVRCVGQCPTGESKAGWYAAVQFARPGAAVRALAKDGTQLLGKTLVVRSSIWLLPEMRDHVPGCENQWPRSAARRLKLEDTLLELPGGETVEKGQVKDRPHPPEQGQGYCGTSFYVSIA